jgi:DNA methylase N-4/N-6
MNGYNNDIKQEQINKLKQLFPEAVTEGKIDWQKLQATLGEAVDLGERYGLSWKGKSDVFATIQEKTVQTLHSDQANSVDWDTTGNMFIEGDNLVTLKILHKAYYGKVKMIYIDPPYNTGNDFIYNDDFKQTRRSYEAEAGITDDEGNVVRDDGLRTNTGGHKHSNWLNMMYPRLFLARNLLRQDGVIFVSIDDNEVHNLRLMMNEIFGEENFVGEYIWHKKVTGGYDNENINTQHEYIIVYARHYSGDLLIGEEKETKYTLEDEEGRKFKWDSLWNVGGLTYSKSLDYPIVAPDGTDIWPIGQRGVAFWLWSKSKVEENRNKLKFEQKSDGSWRVYKRVYASDSVVSGSILDKTIVKGNTYSSREIKDMFDDTKLFDYAKPTPLIKYLVARGSSNDDIILDFFSGSGTTAHAVAELNAEDGGNRRWICVQLPELTDEKSEAYKAGYRTIADIARERIRRAGAKIRADQADKLASHNVPLDLGFRVYRVDDSNFKQWNELVSNPEEIRQQALANLDPLEEGTTDDDLLTELLLKRGISPLAQIDQYDGFCFIPSEKLVICLAHSMTEELFATILATKPSSIILLDRAFGDDINLKVNLLLQAERQGVEVEVV